MFFQQIDSALEEYLRSSLSFKRGLITKSDLDHQKRNALRHLTHFLNNKDNNNRLNTARSTEDVTLQKIFRYLQGNHFLITWGQARSYGEGLEQHTFHVLLVRSQITSLLATGGECFRIKRLDPNFYAKIPSSEAVRHLVGSGVIKLFALYVE